MVNCVALVAKHLLLTLPAAFTQPGAYLSAELCSNNCISLKDGRGPLLLACLAGNENITRKLVLAGANVDVQDRVRISRHLLS